MQIIMYLITILNIINHNVNSIINHNVNNDINY